MVFMGLVPSVPEIGTFDGMIKKAPGKSNRRGHLPYYGTNREGVKTPASCRSGGDLIILEFIKEDGP
jgi:hypothetical protein